MGHGLTVLVDSSAWIGYLHDHRPVADVVEQQLRAGRAALTDIVLTELLVGPTDEGAAASLARMLSRATFLSQASAVDAEAAAALHRTCRREGETPRSLPDCLIAAVAIRHGVPVLHVDRDFDVIARHTALEVLHP